MKKFAILLSLGTLALMSITAKAEVSELRIPLGAGGFGFLPLHIMKKYQLIEKKAAEAGFNLTANWANVGGPSVMNDALQPSSRTGENPPYGMIGRIEETSASFEARSAPRSYPTNSDIRRWNQHFFLNA